MLTCFEFISFHHRRGTLFAQTGCISTNIHNLFSLLSGKGFLNYIKKIEAVINTAST